MTAPAAISRLDDGIATAEDRRIADIFDAHCQWDAARFELRQAAVDADRCVICGRCGQGPECDTCTADHDLLISRSTDI